MATRRDTQQQDDTGDLYIHSGYTPVKNDTSKQQDETSQISKLITPKPSKVTPVKLPDPPKLDFVAELKKLEAAKKLREKIAETASAGDVDNPPEIASFDLYSKSIEGFKDLHYDKQKEIYDEWYKGAHHILSNWYKTLPKNYRLDDDEIDDLIRSNNPEPVKPAEWSPGRFLNDMWVGAKHFLMSSQDTAKLMLDFNHPDYDEFANRDEDYKKTMQALEGEKSDYWKSEERRRAYLNHMVEKSKDPEWLKEAQYLVNWFRTATVGEVADMATAMVGFGGLTSGLGGITRAGLTRAILGKSAKQFLTDVPKAVALLAAKRIPTGMAKGDATKIAAAIARREAAVGKLLPKAMKEAVEDVAKAEKIAARGGQVAEAGFNAMLYRAMGKRMAYDAAMEVPADKFAKSEEGKRYIKEYGPEKAQQYWAIHLAEQSGDVNMLLGFVSPLLPGSFQRFLRGLGKPVENAGKWYSRANLLKGAGETALMATHGGLDMAAQTMLANSSIDNAGVDMPMYKGVGSSFAQGAGGAVAGKAAVSGTTGIFRKGIGLIRDPNEAKPAEQAQGEAKPTEQAQGEAAPTQEKPAKERPLSDFLTDEADYQNFMALNEKLNTEGSLPPEEQKIYEYLLKKAADAKREAGGFEREGDGTDAEGDVDADQIRALRKRRDEIAKFVPDADREFFNKISEDQITGKDVSEEDLNRYEQIMLAAIEKEKAAGGKGEGAKGEGDQGEGDQGEGDTSRQGTGWKGKQFYDNEYGKGKKDFVYRGEDPGDPAPDPKTATKEQQADWKRRAETRRALYELDPDNWVAYDKTTNDFANSLLERAKKHAELTPEEINWLQRYQESQKLYHNKQGKPLKKWDKKHAGRELNTKQLTEAIPKVQEARKKFDAARAKGTEKPKKLTYDTKISTGDTVAETLERIPENKVGKTLHKLIQQVAKLFRSEDGLNDTRVEITDERTRYSADKKRILFNPDQSGIGDFFHETMHTAEARGLHIMETQARDGNEKARDVVALARYLQQRVVELGGGKHAASSPHEAITLALSDPKLFNKLQNTALGDLTKGPKRQFKVKVQGVEFTGDIARGASIVRATPATKLWNALVKLLTHFCNAISGGKKTIKEESVLDAIMELNKHLNTTTEAARSADRARSKPAKPEKAPAPRENPPDLMAPKRDVDKEIANEQAEYAKQFPEAEKLLNTIKEEGVIASDGGVIYYDANTKEFVVDYPGRFNKGIPPQRLSIFDDSFEARRFYKNNLRELRALLNKKTLPKELANRIRGSAKSDFVSSVERAQLVDILKTNRGEEFTPNQQEIIAKYEKLLKHTTARLSDYLQTVFMGASSAEKAAVSNLARVLGTEDTRVKVGRDSYEPRSVRQFTSRDGTKSTALHETMHQLTVAGIDLTAIRAAKGDQTAKDILAFTQWLSNRIPDRFDSSDHGKRRADYAKGSVYELFSVGLSEPAAIQYLKTTDLPPIPDTMGKVKFANGEFGFLLGGNPLNGYKAIANAKPTTVWRAFTNLVSTFINGINPNIKPRTNSMHSALELLGRYYAEQASALNPAQKATVSSVEGGLTSTATFGVNENLRVEYSRNLGLGFGRGRTEGMIVYVRSVPTWVKVGNDWINYRGAKTLPADKAAKLKAKYGKYFSKAKATLLKLNIHRFNNNATASDNIPDLNAPLPDERPKVQQREGSAKPAGKPVVVKDKYRGSGVDPEPGPAPIREGNDSPIFKARQTINNLPKDDYTTYQPTGDGNIIKAVGTTNGIELSLLDTDGNPIKMGLVRSRKVALEQMAKDDPDLIKALDDQVKDLETKYREKVVARARNEVVRELRQKQINSIKANDKLPKEEKEKAIRKIKRTKIEPTDGEITNRVSELTEAYGRKVRAEALNNLVKGNDALKKRINAKAKEIRDEFAKNANESIEKTYPEASRAARKQFEPVEEAGLDTPIVKAAYAEAKRLQAVHNKDKRPAGVSVTDSGIYFIKWGEKKNGNLVEHARIVDGNKTLYRFENGQWYVGEMDNIPIDKAPWKHQKRFGELSEGVEAMHEDYNNNKAAIDALTGGDKKRGPLTKPKQEPKPTPEWKIKQDQNTALSKAKQIPMLPDTHAPIDSTTQVGFAKGARDSTVMVTYDDGIRVARFYDDNGNLIGYNMLNQWVIIDKQSGEPRIATPEEAAKLTEFRWPELRRAQYNMMTRRAIAAGENRVVLDGHKISFQYNPDGTVTGAVLTPEGSLYNFEKVANDIHYFYKDKRVTDIRTISARRQDIGQLVKDALLTEKGLDAAAAARRRWPVLTDLLNPGDRVISSMLEQNAAHEEMEAAKAKLDAARDAVKMARDALHTAERAVQIYHEIKSEIAKAKAAGKDTSAHEAALAEAFEMMGGRNEAVVNVKRAEHAAWEAEKDYLVAKKNYRDRKFDHDTALVVSHERMEQYVKAHPFITLDGKTYRVAFFPEILKRQIRTSSKDHKKVIDVSNGGVIELGTGLVFYDQSKVSSRKDANRHLDPSAIHTRIDPLFEEQRVVSADLEKLVSGQLEKDLTQRVKELVKEAKKNYVREKFLKAREAYAEKQTKKNKDALDRLEAKDKAYRAALLSLFKVMDNLPQDYTYATDDPEVRAQLKARATTYEADAKAFLDGLHDKLEQRKESLQEQANDLDMRVREMLAAPIEQTLEEYAERQAERDKIAEEIPPTYEGISEEEAKRKAAIYEGIKKEAIEAIREPISDELRGRLEEAAERLTGTDPLTQEEARDLAKLVSEIPNDTAQASLADLSKEKTELQKRQGEIETLLRKTEGKDAEHYEQMISAFNFVDMLKEYELTNTLNELTKSKTDFDDLIAKRYDEARRNDKIAAKCEDDIRKLEDIDAITAIRNKLNDPTTTKDERSALEKELEAISKRKSYQDSLDSTKSTIEKNKEAQEKERKAIKAAEDKYPGDKKRLKTLDLDTVDAEIDNLTTQIQDSDAVIAVLNNTINSLMEEIGNPNLSRQRRVEIGADRNRLIEDVKKKRAERKVLADRRDVLRRDRAFLDAVKTHEDNITKLQSNQKTLEEKLKESTKALTDYDTRQKRIEELRIEADEAKQKAQFERDNAKREAEERKQFAPLNQLMFDTYHNAAESSNQIKAAAQDVLRNRERMRNRRKNAGKGADSSIIQADLEASEARLQYVLDVYNNGETISLEDTAKMKPADVDSLTELRDIALKADELNSEYEANSERIGRIEKMEQSIETRRQGELESDIVRNTELNNRLKNKFLSEFNPANDGVIRLSPILNEGTIISNDVEVARFKVFNDEGVLHWYTVDDHYMKDGEMIAELERQYGPRVHALYGSDGMVSLAQRLTSLIVDNADAAGHPRHNEFNQVLGAITKRAKRLGITDVFSFVQDLVASLGTLHAKTDDVKSESARAKDTNVLPTPETAVDKADGIRGTVKTIANMSQDSYLAVKSLLKGDGTPLRELGKKAIQSANTNWADYLAPVKTYFESIMAENSTLRALGENVIQSLYTADNRTEQNLKYMWENGGEKVQNAIAQVLKETGYDKDMATKSLGEYVLAEEAMAANLKQLKSDYDNYDKYWILSKQNPRSMSYANKMFYYERCYNMRKAAWNHKDPKHVSDQIGLWGGLNKAGCNEIIAAAKSKFTDAQLKLVREAMNDLEAARRVLEIEYGIMSPDAAVTEYGGVKSTYENLAKARDTGDITALRAMRELAIKNTRGGITLPVFKTLDHGQPIAENAMNHLLNQSTITAKNAAWNQVNVGIADLYNNMTPQQRAAHNFSRLTIPASLTGRKYAMTLDGKTIQVDPIIMKGGKNENYAFILSPEAMDAYNYRPESSELLNRIGSLTRGYAGLLTKWQYLFPATNLWKDVPERLFNLVGRNMYGENGKLVDSDAIRKDMALSCVDPVLYTECFKYAWGMKNDGAIHRAINELFELGGGFTRMDYLTSKVPDFAKQALEQNISPVKFMKKMSEVAENYNRQFDLIALTSSYLAMRKNGMSKQQAAYHTLDMMNFKKKGRKMAIANAFFPFAQTVIQGGQVMFATLANKNVSMSGKVAYAFNTKILPWVLRVTAASAALNFFFRQLAGDDDDGRNRMDTIAKATQENFINVPFGDKFAKIPLPYGWFRTVYSSVNKVMAATMGDKYAGEAAREILTDSFLPAVYYVEPSEINPAKNFTGWLLTTYAPDWAQPFIEVAINRTKNDAPITYSQDSNKYATRSSGKMIPYAYSWLANKGHPIDFVPENIRHIIRGVAVGPFKQAWDIAVEDPFNEATGVPRKNSTFVGEFTPMQKRADALRLKEEAEEVSKKLDWNEKHPREKEEVTKAEKRLKMLSDRLKEIDDHFAELKKEINEKYEGKNDMASHNKRARELEAINRRRDKARRPVVVAYRKAKGLPTP